MDLKKYLINCILEERNLVEELLYIDNSIGFTNLSYELLIDKLKNIDVYSVCNSNLDYFVITDGEIENVFKVLISIPNILLLYIDRNFLAINKYFVSRLNQFYGFEKIKLDDSSDYYKYIDSNNKIILSGFDEFVVDLLNTFKDKEIIVL